MLSASQMFFSDGGRHSWSLVRRGSQPHCRNRQKTHVYTPCTADPRETTFLYQRISVAIQRFNAVCLANTFTVSESPSQPFRTYIFKFANFKTLRMKYQGKIIIIIRCISQVFIDHCKSIFLCQRLSVLILRFNAVAIRSIFVHTPTEDYI